MHFVAVIRRERFNGFNSCTQGFSLVIFKEHQHRRQAAVGIDKAAWCLTNRRVDNGLVARNLEPLPVTLVKCFGDDTGNVGKRGS